MTQEQKARVSSDALLKQAGWHVSHKTNANIHAVGGVVQHEFPHSVGNDLVNYLLYRDGHVAGVIDVKKEGITLTGAEMQSARYAQGLLRNL